MSRPIRNSKVLDAAMRRHAGMRSIDDQLDFGEGLSLANYDTAIQEVKTLLYEYNLLNAEVARRGAQLAIAEAALKTRSENMLTCVGGRYGKTSLEYGTAGGTIRQRRSKTATATPLSTVTPLSVTNVVNGTFASSANGAGAANALN